MFSGRSNFLPVLFFHVSPKAYSDCKYISTLGTRTWCLFYVNPNVTLQDTRLRKIVGTHGTVKLLISYVNLIAALNKTDPQKVCSHCGQVDKVDMTFFFYIFLRRKSVRPRPTPRQGHICRGKDDGQGLNVLSLSFNITVKGQMIVPD